MNQGKPQLNNKEEEPLYEENIKYHQMSEPTVGKKHDWIQQGPHIVCRSCESPHGFRIGTGKRLKGFNSNGNMIIEKI